MGDVFIKLLNMSIAAGWLVLAVVILRFALKKAPKWIMCALWAMVALRLIMPFSFQSAISVVPSTTTVSVVTQTEETPVPGTTSEVSAVPGEVSAVEPAPAQRTERKIIVINTGFTASQLTIDESGVQAGPKAVIETGGSVDITVIAGIVWISGAALMLLYTAFSYLRLHRKVRASVSRGGYYVCDDIGTPFIFGVFRPRIFVPSGVDQKTLNYVLAHEKAHLKRFDHIWRPLGFLILAVYWFAPLVWIAYILFCRDIELACDEKVVRTLEEDDKNGYSQALLDLSRPHSFVSACPVAFGETGVRERIKKVFSYKKPALWILVVTALISVALVAFLMTDPKEKNVEESGYGSAKQEESIPVEIFFPDESGDAEESSAVEESSITEESSAAEESSVPEESKEESSETASSPVFTPVEDGSVYYTSDKYPGKTVIINHNWSTAHYVVNETLFELEDKNGVKATVYKGDFVVSEDNTDTGYIVTVCNGEISMTYTNKAVKIGDNLVWFAAGYEDAGSPEGNIGYVENGKFNRLTCIGSPVYSEKCDNVCFMNNGQSVSSLAEWIAMNKNGEFVSLPEPGGARRIIASVTLDKSSGDPGAVKVNAYIWNDSEKTYDIKEFSCSLTDCRAVDRVSYYKLRINETYGYIENVEDAVITDDTPADKLTMYFTDPAYPGATLVRLQSNGELYPFLVLGPDCGKVNWNGSEANIYNAELCVLYKYHDKKDEVRKQSVAAIISGNTVALGSETFPFKMHNVYVIDYYTEYPSVCYGISDGEIKFASAGSGDFLTRDNSAYFMCKIFEEGDKYDGRFVRVFDWQGNEYELPVTEEIKASVGKDGKYGYYGFKDIDFDRESGDPDSVVITFKSGVIKANLRDAVQIDPANAKSYSVVYSERSNAENAYSGKRVIFTTQDVYPFYTAQKELFTLDWNGKTAAGCEGKYVELVNGKTRETECYFIACGEKVLRFAKEGRFYALGKLAVYEDAAKSVGTVVTGCGEYFTRYMFDNIYYEENCDVVLLYDSAKLTDGIRPYWMALDKQGNVRSLPFEDNDMLWKLNRIEFDTQSSAGGEVTVTPFIRRLFWANLKYPNLYDGTPFTANLNDTHVVEYEEYYTPDPVDRWDY